MKLIKLKEDTHRRLAQAKKDYFFDTFDDCVNYLVVQDYRRKGQKLP